MKVFERFGLKLQVQATGCCGMAGTYGHEARNAGTSRVIYSQSWQAQVERPAAEAGEALATGYSCRSQVKRMTHQRCGIRCRCCWSACGRSRANESAADGGM